MPLLFRSRKSKPWRHETGTPTFPARMLVGLVAVEFSEDDKNVASVEAKLA